MPAFTHRTQARRSGNSVGREDGLHAWGYRVRFTAADRYTYSYHPDHTFRSSGFDRSWSCAARLGYDSSYNRAVAEREARRAARI